MKSNFFKFSLVAVYALLTVLFIHDADIASNNALAVFDYVAAIYFAFRAFYVLNRKLS